MEITGSLPPAGSTTSNLTSLLKTLQTGQTLSATVVRQLPGGHVELQIGQARISSQPPLPLATGQNIQLRVGDTAPGKLDLHIINNLQNVDTLSRALRENLPRQTPVTQALSQVFQKLVDNKPAGQNLPAPVRDAIKQLVSNLPQTKQLSQPESLRNVLDRSGAKLEAQLHQLPAGNNRTSIIQSDLKANLVRVVQSLREHAGIQQTTQTSTKVSNQPVIAATSSQDQKLNLQQALQSPAVQSQLAQSQAIPQAPAGKPASAPANLLDRLMNLLSASRSEQTTPLPTNQPTTSRQSIANLLSKLPLLNLARQSQPQQVQTAATAQSPAIRAMINELIMQLESGLARIQSNQLQTVAQEENVSRPVLILDLPVNNEGKLDDIRLQIYREQSGSGDELQHIWRVSLFFDFKNLGVIRANIAIHNNQVNTTFHSEQEGTSEVFQQHLDELEVNLKKAGLDIGHIKSLHVDKIDPDNLAGSQSGIFQGEA